jgi:hypothetical protein
MEDKFKDEAIPFVAFDPSSDRKCLLSQSNYTNHEIGFVVTEEAKEMLRAIEGPIGVIAVAGMYRTGKSYLMNRLLLNRREGFGVGPSINPCTKVRIMVTKQGLWIWGRPTLGTTESGESVNVLIVDSEGIGALDEDSNHDTRIFSLAILMSSFFIYNSMGSIDENAL